MDYSECVSFLLVSEGKILLEKRRLDKPSDPGLVAIPGGHMEPGETELQAVKREVVEELGVNISGPLVYLCTLFHYTAEVQKIHYYLIENWEGELQSLEAESVFWIDLYLSASEEIDIPADKVALAELSRLYQYRNRQF